MNPVQDDSENQVYKLGEGLIEQAIYSWALFLLTLLLTQGKGCSLIVYNTNKNISRLEIVQSTSTGGPTTAIVKFVQTEEWYFIFCRKIAANVNVGR